MGRPIGAFFDFDGTLVDTMPALEHAAVDLLIEGGYSPSRASLEYRRTTGAPFLQQMTEFRQPLNNMGELAGRFEAMKVKILAAALPFPGALETLASLMTAGYFVGIVSSTNREMVRGYLKALRFPYYATRGTSPLSGGKDQQLADLVSVYDLDPDRSFFVGDAPRDAEYAKLGEVKFLGVEHTVPAFAFANVGAVSVPTIADVVGWVRENA